MTNTNQANLISQREAEAQDLLARVAQKLETYKAEHAGKPSWGYAGSLGHVNEQLAYILAHLGDRSAVEAKGLPY
jgi:hypothetical protein